MVTSLRSKWAVGKAVRAGLAVTPDWRQDRPRNFKGDTDWLP
jgi:hypothetical protein